MFTRELESVILTLLLKLEDIWRWHAVTYTTKVVVSLKWCMIEMMLLQITNSKWYSSNCDDLQCPWTSFSMSQPFLNGIFLVYLWLVARSLCICRASCSELLVAVHQLVSMHDVHRLLLVIQRRRDVMLLMLANTKRCITWHRWPSKMRRAYRACVNFSW